VLISVCVLGSSQGALDFISNFKSLKQYKKRDSDTEGVRIHVLYAENPNLLKSPITFRYQLEDGNYANVLNDGTKGSNKESTVSNDREWLLESNGHDTVVEAAENPDKYYLTLLELVRKGFSIYLTSPRFTEDYIEEILAVAKDGGAKVYTHSDIYSALASLQKEYEDKLAFQRRKLLEESYTVEPCGLNSFNSDKM
jgi:hypothetical protein